MRLQITCFGRDAAERIDGILKEREFDILIDGNVIASLKLDGGGDQLFEVSCDIPDHLTLGKQHVEVKFVPAAGKLAGGVYGIRMVDRIKV